MTRRPCSGSPICPNLVEGGGPCPDHAKATDQRRGSSHQRGYDHQWRATRNRYLELLRQTDVEGLARCEECGLSELELEHPLEVDHIDGLGPNGPRGHDLDNLQALCRAHHQSKTAHQTKTGGNNQ